VADRVMFNAQDLGLETEMDNQGRVLFSVKLRRELDLEAKQVHLYNVRGHIGVLNDARYEAKKLLSMASPEADVEKLRRAGLK